MPWHGEHYYKWGKMGLEEKALIAGFIFQTHKPPNAPKRPKSYYYILICPEGQVYKYKHFGHALRRATKIIKSQEEKDKRPQIWETALNNIEAYFKGEIPKIDAWSLTSFHKYDYR